MARILDNLWLKMDDQISSQKFILIVEDDHATLEALGDLLKLEGFLVGVVTNGQEALKFMREQKALPDLILTDFMMPIMNGHVLRIEQLADVNLKHIPAILMSGQGGIKKMQETSEFTAYLEKPLDFPVLLETIQTVLQNKVET